MHVDCVSIGRAWLGTLDHRLVKSRVFALTNLEILMEDEIYNLFLTSEQGWSLFGTLRLRRVEADTSTGSVRLPELSEEALVPVTQELTPVPVAGELSVPLLAPFQQVPLRGIAFATAAGLFSFALDSGNARPSAGIQLFPFGSPDLGGFLVWGSTNLGELVFSVLARQVPRAF